MLRQRLIGESISKILEKNNELFEDIVEKFFQPGGGTLMEQR